MWRSSFTAGRRFRSAHTNGVRGFSHSSSDFSQLRSKVQNPQTLASYRHSKDFKSIALFPQSISIRFLSSSSTDSITDVEVSTESNNDVIPDENENNDNFNAGETWNDGVREANSVFETEFSGSGDQETVEPVTDEALEVDTAELDKVISLFKRSNAKADVDDDVASRSLESSLDHMNLILSEEFVVRVLETSNAPVENLISFFKWAAEGKNQQLFSVTTRSLDVLLRAISTKRKIKTKAAYRLRDLFKEIGEKDNSVVTTEVLNALISLLSRSNKGTVVYEIFNQFGDFACDTNADSYYFTIETLCRLHMFDLVGSVCERMLREEKSPEAKEVGDIICSLCRAKMVKEAHSVYLLAKEKQRYPSLDSVNLLFSSLCDRNRNDADFVHFALKMLEDLENPKYAIWQFTQVIKGLCRVNDLEGAKALLSKMIDNGPPPGYAIFNSVINALSKSGDIVEAIKIMRMMENRGLKPDLFAYSVIISGYSKGGEMEEAIKMLTEAKKNHPKLTPVTYHTVIRGYCKLEQFDKALKLLDEMEEYGVRPTIDEYSKLIKSLCLKAADWVTAEKLFKEMTKKGLHLNAITKSLIRAVKELEEEANETKEVSVEE